MKIDLMSDEQVLPGDALVISEGCSRGPDMIPGKAGGTGHIVNVLHHFASVEQHVRTVGKAGRKASARHEWGSRDNLGLGKMT